MRIGAGNELTIYCFREIEGWRWFGRSWKSSRSASWRCLGKRNQPPVQVKNNMLKILSRMKVKIIIPLNYCFFCRFDPSLSEKTSTLYWIRSNRRNHDNVAIGETAFDQDYRWAECFLKHLFSFPIRPHALLWAFNFRIFVELVAGGELGGSALDALIIWCPALVLFL